MKIEVATHIGAYGIITKDNKIALIRKARGGYKGKLDLPGGGIEHTETPEEALVRELQEEAGVTVTKYELFGVPSSNILWQMTEEIKEDLHHIGIIYKVEIKEENVKEEPDGIDSEGCNWYDINELDKEELSPFAKYVVERL
jgi:mutator protein MutT